MKESMFTLKYHNRDYYKSARFRRIRAGNDQRSKWKQKYHFHRTIKAPPIHFLNSDPSLSPSPPSATSLQPPYNTLFHSATPRRTTARGLVLPLQPHATRESPSFSLTLYLGNQLHLPSRVSSLSLEATRRRQGPEGAYTRITSKLIRDQSQNNHRARPLSLSFTFTLSLSHSVYRPICLLLLSPVRCERERRQA